MQIPTGSGGKTEGPSVITGASHMFRGTGLGGKALPSTHALILFLPQFPEGAASPGVSKGAPGPWEESKGQGKVWGRRQTAGPPTAGVSAVASTGPRTEQGKRRGRSQEAFMASEE